MIKAIIINDNSNLDSYYIVGQNNVEAIYEFEKAGEMAMVSWYSIKINNEIIEVNGKFVSRVIY